MQYVVPENIHTSSKEGILFKTPSPNHPSGNSNQALHIFFNPLVLQSMDIFWNGTVVAKS